MSIGIKYIYSGYPKAIKTVKNLLFTRGIIASIATSRLNSVNK